jgi:transforming growth factor-beta-induced protein
MSAIKRTLLILLAVALTSASSSFGADDYGVLEAARDLGNLNTFTSALASADLVGTLNSEGILQFGRDTFIVFAPTDQAFSELPSGTLDALYANTGNLKNVLQYHIVNNDDNKTQDLTTVSSLKTREGESLTISNANGLTVNGARVLGSRRYDHGVIYVIDKVLLPPNAVNQTQADLSNAVVNGAGVLETLSVPGNLNTFRTALEATDLVDRLNGKGTLGTHAGPFTIFAPDDAAFSALPANSLTSLKANTDDLKKLLSYHIVENTDVLNMTTPGSVKTIEGDSLALNTRNGILVNGAKVLSTMRYDNGIIYTIDQVLLPNDTNFLNKYGLTQTNVTAVTTSTSSNSGNESLPPQ